MGHEAHDVWSIGSGLSIHVHMMYGQWEVVSLYRSTWCMVNEKWSPYTGPLI